MRCTCCAAASPLAAAATAHVLEMQHRHDDGLRCRRGNPGWQQADPSPRTPPGDALRRRMTPRAHRPTIALPGRPRRRPAAT